MPSTAMVLLAMEVHRVPRAAQSGRESLVVREHASRVVRIELQRRGRQRGRRHTEELREPAPDIGTLAHDGFIRRPEHLVALEMALKDRFSLLRASEILEALLGAQGDPGRG